jgi:hypothetical protein
MEQVKRKIGHNICTYVVLPLCGTNSQEYHGFEQCWVSKDLKQVLVLFSGELDVLDIPRLYMQDVKYFKEGKYSKLSNKAKDLILKNSGLIYNQRIVKDKRITVADALLLAIEKNQKYQKELEQRLEVHITDDMELFSIPKESEFIDIEEKIQQLQ